MRKVVTVNYGAKFSTISCYFPDTGVCEPLCIDTLNSITSSVGCCFIQEFNRTTSAPEWLSSEFWQRCNLTSPGACTQRFDESESRISDNAVTSASTDGNGNPTINTDENGN